MRVLESLRDMVSNPTSIALVVWLGLTGAVLAVVFTWEPQNVTVQEAQTEAESWARVSYYVGVPTVPVRVRCFGPPSEKQDRRHCLVSGGPEPVLLVCSHPHTGVVCQQVTPSE